MAANIRTDFEFAAQPLTALEIAEHRCVQMAEHLRDRDEQIVEIARLCGLDKRPRETVDKLFDRLTTYLKDPY